MAEAIVVVGLISSICQILQFSVSAMNRLHEFHLSAGHTPKTFQDIEAQLPLLIDTLKRIHKRAEAGACSEDTQVASLSVIKNCGLQVEALNILLRKVLPSPSDSLLMRTKKSLSSLFLEGEVQQIRKTLRQSVALLTYHQSAVLSNVDPVEPKPDDSVDHSISQHSEHTTKYHVSRFPSLLDVKNCYQRLGVASTGGQMKNPLWWSYMGWVVKGKPSWLWSIAAEHLRASASQPYSGATPLRRTH